MATSLVASQATLASGDTFTLTPTYSGGTAVLSYWVPYLVTCPATGVATAPITADWAGLARTYVLTVTNAVGASATTSVTVTLAAPTSGLTISTATPPYRATNITVSAHLHGRHGGGGHDPRRL